MRLRVVMGLSGFWMAVLIALPSGQATGTKHKISIAFDYDFTPTPACSSSTKTPCIEQFNAYDISAGLGKRTKLISIPVPPGAHGVVKGIVATTPLLVFEPGKHLLAVTAQMSDGTESDPNKCTIWVQIPE